MKNICLLFLLHFSLTLHSQNIYLEAVGVSKPETASIDSIGYFRVHPNIKSATDAAKGLHENLRKSGWLQAEITKQEKINDSTFKYDFVLGKATRWLHIYIGRNAEAKNIAFGNEVRDTLQIPFSRAEEFLNNTLSAIESKGFSLAKVRLSELDQGGHSIFGELIIELGAKRQLNDIIVSGYDKFPAGHKKSILRQYKNKTFSQASLKKIYDDFARFRFVTQTRYPEILFTKDTTKVYVYLEKAKPNRSDGYVGFSNDEEEGDSKIRFNGYVDLLLVNFLNTGEEFSLFWKSDGKEQKTFNASIDLPYIFKSRFALRANLNIFRQDSTFQNTKTAIGLGYLFNYNTRLYAGYESTESSDILNANSFSVSDFKSRFFTTTFNYSAFRENEFLFPENTKIQVRAGLGSRESKLQEDSQFFGEIHAMQNFYLNDKNIINLKSQNFILQSGEYLISELYRFGGINSIRGFNEGSLQANIFSSLLSEYRYVLAPGIYAHSIIDYGWFRDDTSSVQSGKNGNLLGLGFGFGLLTKNGMFNIVYANGTADGQAIKLGNSIVHLSFKASF